MEEDHENELKDLHKSAAKAFIKQATRKNEGQPSWDSRSPEQREHWQARTEFVRSNIEPALFEYADQRSKGLEPSPDLETWAGRSKDQERYDRATRQLGITQPHPVNKRGGFDWNKPLSQDREENEPSPSDSAEPYEKSLGSDSPDKLSLSKESNQGLPKARISVPPEKIKENDLKTLNKDHYEGQAEQWEQDLDNPENGTEIPADYYQHPGRLWTEDDEEQLLDIIDSGEHDFARIGWQIQRTEDDCHRKYQHLAGLEVTEPRIGVWSAQQDADLLKFVEEYNMTDWDRIAYHCGTTTAEARRYWASRKSTAWSQLAESSTPKADAKTAVTSTTNTTMIWALDEAVVSNDHPSVASRSSRAPVSSNNYSSVNEQPSGKTPSVQNVQKSRSGPTAASSGTQLDRIARLTMAKGRKRGLSDFEEVDEGTTENGQPKHKARRTEILNSGLASHVPEPVSVRTLRRSTRLTKGERKYDRYYLWYDPRETKSLSNTGVSNDSASHPAASRVRSKSIKAATVPRERHRTGKQQMANQNDEESEAPIARKATRRQKRSRVDADNYPEAETTSRKRRRTELPEPNSKIHKNGSAARQATSTTRALENSSRVVQGAADPQISVAPLVAAPARTRAGRAYGRKVHPGAETLEESMPEKTKHNTRRAASGKKSASNAKEVPGDESGGTGQYMTGRKAISKGQKRGREAETDVDEEPPRKFLKGHTGGISGSTPILNPEGLHSAATHPTETLETPSASEEQEKILLQPRKPRHRAGLDRRMGHYPPTRGASKRP